MADTENPSPAQSDKRCPMRRLSNIALGFLLPLVVLAGGLFGFNYLMATGPTAERKRPPRRPHLIAVTTIALGDHPTVIHAMGTVRPAREIELRARVNGEVVFVDSEFVPGGRFAAGAPMLSLDPTDFHFAIEQRLSELIRVESRLQQELGSQSVARREFELLGEDIPEADRSLVLREPQLTSMQAERESAVASLDDACIDLARTEIRAPFNALIATRSVELGSQVGVNTPLAKLVGTDAYWLEVLVSVSDLRWLYIPLKPGERGSTARIYDEAAWGAGVWREGRVIRLLSEIEAEGRMARLLVEVRDPLGLSQAGERPPILLVNSFLKVEFEGRRQENVAVIARHHMRKDREGAKVWLMDAEDKLEIRPVEVSFQGDKVILVSAGLEGGERLVTSELSSPVEGMPLRLDEPEEEETSDER